MYCGYEVALFVYTCNTLCYGRRILWCKFWTHSVLYDFFSSSNLYILLMWIGVQWYYPIYDVLSAKQCDAFHISAINDIDLSKEFHDRCQDIRRLLELLVKHIYFHVIEIILNDFFLRNFPRSFIRFSL